MFKLKKVARHARETFRAMRQFGSTTLIPRTKETMDQHPFLSNAIIYGGLYSLAEISRQTIHNRFSNKATTSPNSSVTNHQSKTKNSVSNHLDKISNPVTTTIVSNRRSVKADHSYDVNSIKRYAIMGTAVFGPILTKWYFWLDNKFPCTSKGVVLKKLFLDQFILTPWLIAVFYIGMSVLEGLKNDEVFCECRTKLLPTFAMDTCYWLPVQALNFMFVPPWLRVAYVGITTFVWLNVLCYIKAMPAEKVEKVEKKLIKKEKDFIEKEKQIICQAFSSTDGGSVGDECKAKSDSQIVAIRDQCQKKL